MLLPYKLETERTWMPVANIVLMAVTVLFFLVQVSLGDDNEFVAALVLREWDPVGMIGTMFLHGGVIHLLGNMLYLWVFGNAVNSAVGNVRYPLLYVLFGLIASCVHLLFSSKPAIGASGAINGVVGMSFALFPLNKLRCLYLLSWFWGGRFEIRSYWMIAIWFVFDILGVLLGGGGVAYWAHIGGFAGGLALGMLFTRMEWIDTFEPTLLEVIQGKAPKGLDSEETKERMFTRTQPTPEHEQEIVVSENKEFREQQRAHEGKVQDLHRLWTGESADTDTPQPSVATVNNAANGARVASHRLSLRVLKTEHRGDTVMCYFVNEGDEVRNVTARLPDGGEILIHPVGVMKKHESGWLRISGVRHLLSAKLVVTIGYDDGSGRKGAYDLPLPPGQIP